MPSDRSLVRVVPGSLMPTAVRAHEAAERVLPDDPHPLGRLARYALLTLVVYGSGIVAAAVVADALGLVTVALSAVPGDLLADPWAAFVGLVASAIELFALLLAVGLFLTQFERGD